MGARVVRMMRNFNLENRVHREISRDKPRAAPWHTGGAPAATDAFEGEGTYVTQHRRREKDTPRDVNVCFNIDFFGLVFFSKHPGEQCSREERFSAEPPQIPVCGVNRPRTGQSSSRTRAGCLSHRLS